MCDHFRAFATQEPVFGLEFFRAPQGRPQFELVLNGGEQARIVPRFEDEILGAFFHRLDGEFHAAPGGHHHDGQVVVEVLESFEKVQTFLAGGGVPRIIHVHQRQIELRFGHRPQRCLRRIGGLGLTTFAFEKKLERRQNIRLIIHNQDHGRAGLFHAPATNKRANANVKLKIKN